jgi:RNA polymerase sigma factor (TIGR02999 family)
LTRPTGNDITRILADLGEDDDDQALARLLPLVYDELRALADLHLRNERAGHTLQPTALVHEAYLRLLGPQRPSWADRGHFFRAAAQAMRRILIEHARKRGRIKRGGSRARLPASVLDFVAAENPADFVALEEALRRLEEQDPRLGRVVNLRFFAGLSVEETALALGVSERTVKRGWTVARAWLYRALKEDDE